MTSHTVDIEKADKKEQTETNIFLIERDYRTNVIRFMEYMPVELEKIVRYSACLAYYFRSKRMILSFLSPKSTIAVLRLALHNTWKVCLIS